jgi:DNA-binding transcriptional MerR regulator
MLSTTAYAQESINTGRRKYYRVEELIKLIQRAREAGMSDESIRKMEIRDGDKEINLLDYIEQEKLDRLKSQEYLKELMSKNFLTVNDIYRELIKTEPEVIQKLREELVSER